MGNHRLTILDTSTWAMAFFAAVFSGNLTPAAIAQEQDSPSEVTEQTDEPAYELRGSIETGARVVIDRPPREERAKFEEYGEISDGLLLENLHLGITIKDSGAFADFWATHAGRDDQNFRLELGAPGKMYITGEWDEIPHQLSTSARTVFDNSDPGRLTVSPALVSDPDEINNRALPFDLNVERETKKAALRFTPSPGWDFLVDYSNEQRNGTRGRGTTRVSGSGSPRFSSIEILEPIVYDTTNVSAKGQYLGTYRPGKTWLIGAGYNRSDFRNQFQSMLWEDPFSAGDFISNSLPPDNYAEYYSATVAADLPMLDARYVGTVTKGHMKQTGRFVPFEPDDLNDITATRPTGDIETLIQNHTLNARFGHGISGTARYQYHSLENRNRLDPSDIDADSDEKTVPPDFVREKASANLKWRVKPWITAGVTYFWDRYEWDRREVNIREEQGGKIFIDAKPDNGMLVHAGYMRSERRFDDYNQISDGQNDLMRKFSFADRDRSKLWILTEIPLSDLLIVTPTFSWQQDKFGDNLATGGTLGLKKETIWAAGAEILWDINDNVSLMSSYMRERLTRKMVNGWGSNIDDVVHTFITTATFILIEDSLNLKLSHVWSASENETDTFSLGGSPTSDPQFPNVKNTFTHFNAVLVYFFGEEFMNRLGLKGEGTAEFSYTYEKNDLRDWQIDDMLPYMVDVDPGTGDSLFLASFNPNYEGHILGMTFKIKW